MGDQPNLTATYDLGVSAERARLAILKGEHIQTWSRETSKDFFDVFFWLWTAECPFHRRAWCLFSEDILGVVFLMYDMPLIFNKTSYIGSSLKSTLWFQLVAASIHLAPVDCIPVCHTTVSYSQGSFRMEPTSCCDNLECEDWTTSYFILSLLSFLCKQLCSCPKSQRSVAVISGFNYLWKIDAKRFPYCERALNGGTVEHCGHSWSCSSGKTPTARMQTMQQSIWSFFGAFCALSIHMTSPNHEMLCNQCCT